MHLGYSDKGKDICPVGQPERFIKQFSILNSKLISGTTSALQATCNVFPPILDDNFDLDRCDNMH